MSVNLSRLLTIVALTIGLLAIYSVNAQAADLSSAAYAEMDSGTYVFSEIQNFMSDVLSGSLNDMFTTLGAAAAGVGTGVVAIVKLT